jgi:hypothetical protein
MSLPDFNSVNQGSLQDFQDCRRRFYLRHILRLAWPAIESQPVLENELFIKQGAAFHQLVHQYLIGIPANRLTEMIHEPNLYEWWTSFISHLEQIPGLSGEGISRFPEITLNMNLDGYRLIAKFDLIVYLPEGRFIIYDWKTSRHQSRRETYLRRWQTRLYPYILAHTGKQLLPDQDTSLLESISPDRITFVYWFPAFPESPLIFPYTAIQLQNDHADLSTVLNTINRLLNESNIESFPITTDEKLCKFCVYRSLCNRGTEAGMQMVDDLEDGEPLIDLDIDFDQIAELEF